MDEKLTKRDVIRIVQELLSVYQLPVKLSSTLTMLEGRKIYFPGLGSQFDIYRQAGDSGKLIIDSATDTENSIRIGETNKPLDVYITGTDEAVLRANNNTNISYLLVEPGRAGIFTDKGNDFTFRLPNGSGDPSGSTTGMMAVVSGKLKIYNGSAWVVVGDQTA